MRSFSVLPCIALIFLLTSLTACQVPPILDSKASGADHDSQPDTPARPTPQEVTFVVTDELTGLPVKHQPYRITLPDNRVVEGITNDKGETDVATSEVHGKFKLQLLPRKWTK